MICTVTDRKCKDCIAQGIFLKYGVTDNDVCEEERIGGIGSTGK